jgi:hypothetical protein
MSAATACNSHLMEVAIQQFFDECLFNADIALALTTISLIWRIAGVGMMRDHCSLQL